MTDEINKKNDESINGTYHRKTTCLSMNCMFYLKN